MSDPRPGRTLASWVVTIVCLLIFFAMLVEATGWLAPSPSPSASAIGTSPDWGLGDGLVTVQMSQNVTGTPYWAEFCVPPQPARGCTNLEGVVYVPSTNLVVLTEQHDNVAGGTNAYTEIDPTTLAIAPLHQLSCVPQVPFYPGSGVDFYVPCLNTTYYNYGPLLVVNDQSGLIVKNVSLPFRTNSMAFDSDNGMIYITSDQNNLTTFDPVNESVVETRSVASGDFSSDYSSFGYELVFDSLTNQLIAPGSNGSLLEIDPASGLVVGSIPLGSPTIALAVAPASNLLLASTSNSPSVVAFNSGTYQLEATTDLPDCFAYVCGSGFVNQILVDPTHGDAYLVASNGLFTLNLSALGVVGIMEDFGDGPQLSAAYVPASDRIFGTYSGGLDEPGFLIQLSHTQTPIVTNLLWLPISSGAIVLAAVIGSVLAVGIGLHARRERLLHSATRDTSLGPS
jgi:hypothetical protein